MAHSAQEVASADAVRAAGPNLANINTLIETLRGIKPARFNMNYWTARLDPRHSWVSPSSVAVTCGTCACLGGWTNALFGGDGGSEAQSDLGLTTGQANALFYPSHLIGEDGEWHITRRQAVRVLEHLRDTGEVDWSKRGRR